MVDSKEIYAILTELKDPVSGETLFKLGLLKDISLTNNNLSLTLIASNEEEMASFEKMIREALKNCGIPSININRVLRASTELKPKQKAKERVIEGVKKIIAIGSGKGGVGKSTVAANLAAALSIKHLEVGLFDGDIYGPSISKMFGIDGIAPMVENQKMIPANRFGLKILSMGQLVDEETPVLWRGPLIHKAYEQFLYDTLWGALDILLVDLPPGTGDAQLSAIQLVNLDGAIIVTTPQDVSLIEVKKAINMFRKNGVKILGVVENMSYFMCPQCGTITHIFGNGGAKKLNEKMDVKVLAEIPVSPLISKSGDEGMPVVLSNGDEHPEIRETFLSLANNIIEEFGL